MVLAFITLHLFVTSETYNSDCQKNKLQRVQKPTPGQSTEKLRHNFILGTCQITHIACTLIDRYRKPLTTGGKKQCDRARQHYSSKEFSGAMTALPDAYLSSYFTTWQKTPCFFSSIFRRKKNNPPNKPKVKVPT